MMMYQDSETDDFSDEYLFALGDTAEVDDTSAAPLTEPDTSLDEANILQTVRQAYRMTTSFKLSSKPKLMASAASRTT
ncbi:hypothetical protein A1F94_010587 [Pyrenophora tritici-repentis]|nr:hypothetical protein A1F94_010587 [Pyrenophora tritici-repentis]